MGLLGARRIALVSVNFTPEPTGIGPYTRAYADLLHGAGAQVTVITGHPHYPQWRRSLATDGDRPYPVRRSWHFVPRKPTLVGRILYELTFSASVLWRLTRERRFDAVIAILPPLLPSVTAALWSRSHGVPYGVVVQDLVSLAAEQTRSSRGVPFALASRLERVALASAAAVAVISDAMRTTALLRSVQPERLMVTPNWPLADQRSLPSKDRARERMHFRKDEWVCVYAGSMGVKQGLEVIVESARAAETSNRPFRYVLIGDGSERQELEHQANGLSNIEFWPVLPEQEFWDCVVGADVLLVSQKLSVRNMSFASKLISYARTGNPMVAAVASDSAVGEVLVRFGAGLVVDPTPATIVSAIARIQQDSVLRDRLAHGAAAYYESELDVEKLQHAFLRFTLASVSTKLHR